MSRPLRFLGPSPNPCASACKCPIGIIASKGAIYPKHTVTEMLCNSRIRLDWKSKLDLKVTYRFSENRCAQASQASFLSRHAFLLSWLDVMLWAQRVFGAGGRNEVHLGTSLTSVISPFGHVLDLSHLSIWTRPWPWSSVHLDMLDDQHSGTRAQFPERPWCKAPGHIWEIDIIRHPYPSLQKEGCQTAAYVKSLNPQAVWDF